MLFFIELDNRRVHLGGVTANPDGGWSPAGRNLLLALGEQGRHRRFLVRDHDAKFSRSFDDVFCSEGAQVLMTPVRAPKANAYSADPIGANQSDVEHQATDVVAPARSATAER